MIVFKISLLVWCLVSVSVAVGSIAISLPRKILALVFVSPVFFISFSNIPDPPSFRFGTFYSIQVWGLDDWQLFFFFVGCDNDERAIKCFFIFERN